jgi:HTH-like domain
LIYQFIDTEKANYPIYVICDVLNIDTSAYYYWAGKGRRLEAARAASEAELVAAIRTVHAWSNRTYGAVKIHDHLIKAGRHVSCRRVAELMSEHRIYGFLGVRPVCEQRYATRKQACFLISWSAGSNRVDQTLFGMAISLTFG